MSDRKAVVDYISNLYSKRVGQLEIAELLKLTRDEVSTVTCKLGYSYGLDTKENPGDSWFIGNEFNFLDDVELPDNAEQ